MKLASRMAYRESEGEAGVPLVLLHAYPMSSWLWHHQLVTLGAERRVIAPDLPGFGMSPPPPAFSVEVWADQIAAFLDELMIDRAVIGGCSMGGYITFALARRHPERVAGLLLVDTRANADTDEARAKRRAQQELVERGGMPELVEGMLSALVSPRTRSEKPQLVDELRVEMFAQPELGIVGALQALAARPDSTPLLSQITKPTLVVVGEDDTITPPDAARAIAAGIAGAQLEIIPGAGHLPSIEQPEAFDRVASAFLSKIR